MKKFWSVVLVGFMALSTLDAEAARRMGGGKSFGKQSNNVTQREAAPAAPAAPGGMAQNANAAKPAAAPGAAAAAAPKKPWAGMLGGLAAGLGLAWLASSLGLGAAFGQFMLIALLVLVGFVVFGMVMRSRKSQAAGGMQGARATAHLPSRVLATHHLQRRQHPVRTAPTTWATMLRHALGSKTPRHLRLPRHRMWSATAPMAPAW